MDFVIPDDLFVYSIWDSSKEDWVKDGNRTMWVSPRAAKSVVTSLLRRTPRRMGLPTKSLSGITYNRANHPYKIIDVPVSKKAAAVSWHAYSTAYNFVYLVYDADDNQLIENPRLRRRALTTPKDALETARPLKLDWKYAAAWRARIKLDRQERYYLLRAVADRSFLKAFEEGGG